MRGMMRTSAAGRTAMAAPVGGARRTAAVRARHRVAVTLAAGALVLVGCSSDGDADAEAAADGSQEALEEGADEAVDAEPDAADADDADDADASDDEEPVEVEEAEPRLALPDVDPITLTTPGRGGGAWPVLAWEQVEGAAEYQVTVYEQDGDAFWSWTTEETDVRLGGLDEEPDPGSAIGPQLQEPMTWDVVARDGDGTVVAVSGERPIEP